MKVTQLCLTVCDPMDCSPLGSSVHGILQARIVGVGCRYLLQGIFPTQGLNLGLLQCRQILYHLSLQGSPPAVIGNSNKKDCGCVAVYYPLPPIFYVQNHILNYTDDLKLVSEYFHIHCIIGLLTAVFPLYCVQVSSSLF